jgi:hypothetical protein
MELKMERISKNATYRTAIAAIGFSLLGTLPVGAQEASFVDFPFLVHCNVNGFDRAFYLGRISPDGVALYVSPENQAATITITGKAEPIGVVGSGDCAGKTLEQLRSQGVSFYLRP